MECVFEGVRWGCGVERILRGATLYIGRYRSDFIGDVFSGVGGAVLHDPRGIYSGDVVLEYGLDIRLDLLSRPELLMSSLYSMVRELGMDIRYWMMVLPVLVSDVRREYDEPSLYTLYEVAGERAEESGGIEKAGYVELHMLLGMVTHQTDGRVLEPSVEPPSIPHGEGIVIRYSGCGPWARMVIPQMVFSLLLGGESMQILMDGDTMLRGPNHMLRSLAGERAIVHSNRLDHRVIPFFDVLVEESDYLELYRDAVARILRIVSEYGELTAGGVYVHMGGVEKRLVYGLLERLWRDGYLRREVGRPRPVYRLTAKGVGLLREVYGDE